MENVGVIFSAMVRIRQAATPSGLGVRLARLRRARNMTQVELAAAVGVTQSLISFYEKGTTEPSAAVMVQLARVLGVTADELLGLKPAHHAGTQETGNLRLMRKLQRVQQLPPKDRRNVVQYIDALLERQSLKRAQG